MHSLTKFITLAFLAGAPLVSAHGMITFASGDAGGKGIGLGVTSSTSNSENDVTIFREVPLEGHKYVGLDLVRQYFMANKSLKGSGNINPATDLATEQQIAGSTLPQLSAGGTLTMTFHQVNADGAGPISCQVSADGTGSSFAAMQVTTNVPGFNGLSLAGNEDFPLVAQMPNNLTCTGTIGSVTNACVVQCMNPVGPFWEQPCSADCGWSSDEARNQAGSEICQRS